MLIPFRPLVPPFLLLSLVHLLGERHDTVVRQW